MEQVIRFRAVMRETVNTIARVVGVQRDDALKLLVTNLRLQQAYLRLRGIPPELAIQIRSGPGAASAIGETAWVTHRINEELVVAPHFGTRIEGADKVYQTEDRLGLIPVNACEEAHLDPTLHPLCTLENEARHPEALFAHVPHADRVGDQVGRSGDLE
jgi:hypothetical protein